MRSSRRSLDMFIYNYRFLRFLKNNRLLKYIMKIFSLSTLTTALCIDWDCTKSCENKYNLVSVKFAIFFYTIHKIFRISTKCAVMVHAAILAKVNAEDVWTSQFKISLPVTLVVFRTFLINIYPSLFYKDENCNQIF